MRLSKFLMPVCGVTDLDIEIYIKVLFSDVLNQCLANFLKVTIHKSATNEVKKRTLFNETRTQCTNFR